MSKVSAKDAIILINGYNFSTYATAFEATQDVNKIDVTGFTEGSKNFIPGQLSADINAAVLWDSAALKTHPVFSPLTATGYVTIIPEGYALGNNTISLPFMQGNYQPKGTPDSAIEVGTLNFRSYGNNVGVEYGWALQHATITATTLSTAVLDPSDAAVTAACSGTLHIWTACATDTYVVKIQHCATIGGVYADLVTFTLNGSAIGAERVAVASGTINKYKKVLATRTGAAGDDFGFTVHFQHQ